MCEKDREKPLKWINRIKTTQQESFNIMQNSQHSQYHLKPPYMYENLILGGNMMLSTWEFISQESILLIPYDCGTHTLQEDMYITHILGGNIIFSILKSNS